jgi:transcriptional regulator with XRE-family HTH domain
MTANRADVRSFLITRRAKITPEQAGLTFYGGNRRVPGLRREEVAMLAGVSADYYVRLEKGNLSGVSDSVLDAIAGALQLDEAERLHLRDLARAANASPARAARRRPPRQIRPGIQLILDGMNETPAFVRNGRLDILAINALGRALYSPAFTGSAVPVNLATFRFLDPAARDFYPDFDESAHTTVALLRTEAGRDPSTRTSPTSSASYRPAATNSAPCGHATTSACTAPASSTSTTQPLGTSTSCSRPWPSKPTKALPSPHTRRTPAHPPAMA